MSSLRERLLRLKSSSVEAESVDAVDRAATVQEEEEQGAEVLSAEWDVLGVRLQEADGGTFLLRETRYELGYQHGVHHLAELWEAAAGLAAFNSLPLPKARRVAKAQEILASKEGQQAQAEIVPDNILFFDLETTGLGVGAGNVPFMIGLGYARGNAFIVEQMLIRHPAEERAMLAYLCAKLPSFTHLATYNGRTFDWPVLQNRLILNGYRSFSWEPVHIDLLHPSRSLWRNTLPSCKLSRIEEDRLGINRVDDVPGSLAPAIYFQFLSDGDPGPLMGIFRHNEIDMVSLACLAIRFGYLLSGGLGETVKLPDGAEERVRTGLWLEKMQGTAVAEPLYALLTEDDEAPSQVLLMLAERDKKYGNWSRAVLLWQKVVHRAELETWPGWEAHIELAMYYEHKNKQFESALVLAETALALAQRRYSSLLRLDAKRRTELEGLRKRVDRLRTKMGRLSS